MKILRVKLTNLNSLRGTHAVDFEAPPLAGAGLFAIVGPTGAGKSTLLDAITLALYGRAARYANTSNPEDMMSRHCGECQAEVEFAVPAGRFRATWQLRRARGKADGKPQGAKRYVYDAAGQVLAQTIREAEVCIEKLVGLDYPRFLRSVMLAQGEFARFLKANPDERAELLESLTGTAIYSELSVLAHDETGRRENELLRKEETLRQVVLLTPEQRQERAANLQRLETDLAGHKHQLDELNRRLGRARELQKALANQADLTRQQQALQARAQAAQPEISRLTRHRLTLPLAEALNRLDAALGQAGEQAEKRLAAAGEQQQTQGEWGAGLAAACEFAASLLQQEQAALAQAQGKIQHCEAQRTTIAQWLEARAEDKNLEAQLPSLVELLSRLGALRAQAAKEEDRCAQHADKIQRQQQTKARAENELAGAAQRLETGEAEKAAAVKALTALRGDATEAARAQRLEAWQRRGDALGRLLDLEKTSEQSREDLKRDQEKLAGLKPKLEQAQAAWQDALARKHAADVARAQRGEHLTQARLAASFEAHRAALKPGEPCPLCGATEHPLAGAPVAGATLAALEADVSTATAAFETAEQAASRAESEQTRLQAEQASLARRIEDSQARLATEAKRFRTLAQAHEIQAQDALALAREQAEGEALIRRAKAELEEIKSLKNKVDDSENQRVRAESALAMAKQTLANEEKALADLQRQLRERQEELAQLAVQYGGVGQSLQELLQPFHVALPEPGREPQTRQELEQRKKTWQQQTLALDHAASALDQARVDCAQCAQNLAMLQVKAQPFQAALTAHQLSAARPTPARVRALGAGWQKWEDAEHRVRALESATAAAAAAVLEREAEGRQAAERVRQCQDQLARQLTGSPFASVEALRAAKLTAPEADRLEHLAQELQRLSDQLQGKLEAVREHLLELRAANADEALDPLEAELRTAQQAHEDLVGTLRQGRDELRRDEEAREQHAARAAALERERAALRVWQQLRGLIGSHDGRKFRRYAQGISLDILIHHANAHLQRLTDRYALRRRAGEELELEIADHYQAGVTRPMASLSGGESFLGSLALALGLADLAGRNVRIDSLFIDEGFGALDADTLDLAISALETLRQDHKTVGVISHVDLLKERIATQIQVEKQSAGASLLRLAG